MCRSSGQKIAEKITYSYTSQCMIRIEVNLIQVPSYNAALAPAKRSTNLPCWWNELGGGVVWKFNFLLF
jgi:hypothetical protein